MQIRRIDIENFRGVKRLSWKLPPDRRFFVLIGPGDASKSTVLTAISHCLSDRWNVAFSDTDFHNGAIESPIRIKVAVAGLPDDLLALDAFGSHLCGIYPDGRLTHDAQDDNAACVVVELRVDADLEPQWFAHRPGDADEDAQTVRASLRSRFGAYRIDERVDAHLRWSRMSALGKLTERKHGTKQTLTAANRAARHAVADTISPELAALARQIQARVHEIGSAEFTDLKPGLDTSLTNTQGNLALFDGAVPLMNFGLGTRRLAGAATQQLANEGSALLLVDEVEYGLEPHRLVHLLGHLRSRDAYAQVFVTTHSPTALQHLDAADLVMVRTINGETQMRSLSHPASLQRVIRSTPEGFLARRVVVTEGKTEYGIVLGLLEEWDRAELPDHVPSAALGVVAVEGHDGGTGAANMALELLTVGYQVTLFIDSDADDANVLAKTVAERGGDVVQWEGDHCTEAAICAELDADGLTALIQLSIQVQEDPETATQAHLAHLANFGAPPTDTPDAVASWLSDELDLAAARTIVAKAAHKKGWFKNVDRGKALAKFILSRNEMKNGRVLDTSARLRKSIYEQLAADAGAAETGESAVSEGVTPSTPQSPTSGPVPMATEAHPPEPSE